METRMSPSISALHSLAKEAGLKHYLTLSKPELFRVLKQSSGLTSRQLQFHNQNEQCGSKRKTVSSNEESNPPVSDSSVCSRPSKRKAMKIKKRRKQLNSLDPIMLEPIGRHRFEFVRPNGTAVQYNVESLVAYILATGKFSEPETRIQFSDDNLRDLDMKVKRAGIEMESVVEAKKRKYLYDQKRIDRDGILGEQVVQMLAVVEESDPEEGQIRLLTTILPSFSDLYEQITVMDEEYAAQCMDHYVAFLKGPPNKPTKDKFGFLSIVLKFLQQLREGDVNTEQYGFK